MNLKELIQHRIRKSIYFNFPFDDLEKDEKYISIFTSKGKLSNGKVFEYNHYKNGNNCLIPDNTSTILGFIRGFNTLYDHAADIENNRLASFYQALLSLKELWKSGLLISQTELLNKIANNEAEHTSPGINTLGWITRNRPESIKKRPILKIFCHDNNLIPLISDSDNFKSKMYSRTVLQSHKSLTVGAPNFLLGMNLGIDNTEILPPFHPNFRNSDGIFASVLRKCFSNCFCGHLPFAISHIPPDERTVDDSDIFSASVRIPDVLKYSIDEYNNIAVSSEEGLKSLGNYLRDISKRSENSFKEYLSIINSGIITSKFNHTSQLYKKHKHLNKQWAEIMEQRMEVLYKSLQGDISSVHLKEIENLSNEDQFLILRKVYRNFGNLMFHWTDIYACAEKNIKTTWYKKGRQTITCNSKHGLQPTVPPIPITIGRKEVM